MKIEDLLACSSEKLDAIEKEGKLEEYLKPYLSATRPEFASVQKAAKSKPSYSAKSSYNDILQQKLALVNKLAAEKGLNIKL